MAIVNDAKESFLSRKRWNRNEAGSWCSFSIPKTSSKNSDSNSNKGDQEGSQRNIMSNSVPKSFQQSTSSSCYHSRSSSSTPISIAESESDTSDTIDGSISSSTKQYYDGKTWEMYYRIVNQRKMQKAYRKDKSGHATKMCKASSRGKPFLDSIHQQNDVCQECHGQEEGLPCLDCLEETIFEMEM